MGRLTTHILDTAGGRLAGPILEGDAFTAGVYELQFRAGDYLRARGIELAEPAFLDVIPVRFGIANPTQHYHVPLLLCGTSVPRAGPGCPR